jgi:hypothetical protein
MKKIITMTFLSFLIGSISISCDRDDDATKEIHISANELPTEAKTFLTTHFSIQDIVRVIKNVPAESNGTVYEVDLHSGMEIDFAEDGTWRKVDNKNNFGTIPTGFIDPKIMQYISTNYPNININSIEKDYSHQ